MNDGSRCKCIDYRTRKDCDFKFMDEHQFIIKNRSYGDFLNGSLKNPYSLSVCNIGYIGNGYNYSDKPEAYKIWSNMIHRCYQTRTDRRRDINYKKCIISGDWQNFQNFVDWYDNNIKLYMLDDTPCIDKDLLYKNNRIYSPKTCLLIPEEINIFMTNSKFKRGEFPIGVYFDKDSNNFKAQCNDPLNRYSRNIGRYNTAEEAFYAYKNRKEQYAKDLANCFYGKIDIKAIQALQNYTVDIND